jgi:hypothetical protein
MVVYAFDVDETLEVSKGPVKLFELVELRERAISSASVGIGLW